VLKVAVLADAAPSEAEPDTVNEAIDQLAAEAATKAADGPESTTTRKTQRTPALPSPRELAAKAAEQKCPECGHAVGAEDDACPSCGYFWSAGRPNARTLVPPERSGEEERRENVRVPVVVPVLYMSDTLTFESQARDLSRGGMFIRTELLDPVGTPCMLTVLPDGGAAVVMQGVVAHVVESRADRLGRSPGLGVKFASLSPDAERWLGHALEERPKRV
jgi:hypothetical protein